MIAKPNVGDIVLCWRATVIAPEYYEAEVLRVIGDVCEVRPIKGLFRYKRFVGHIHIEGIVGKA